jgi:hypothetical protein
MEAKEDHPREGYVVFLPWAPGSRSESLQPFLVTGPGSAVRLFCPGDNPFQNESLKACHLHWCSLRGQWDAGKSLLLVSDIRILEDPASGRPS